MRIPSNSPPHQPRPHKSGTVQMSSSNLLPPDLLEPSSLSSPTTSRRAFSSVPDYELEAALGLTPSPVHTKSPDSEEPHLSSPSNTNSLTQDTIPPSLIPPLHSVSRYSSSTVSPPQSPPKPVEPVPNTSGLSAVEVAKRAAEEFTLAELKKKRRNANGVPLEAKRLKLDSSCSDQDCPEKISHKKYQKRLQKNRDSAFVSRIRRREYTKILEKSLVQVEKEKNAALACFHEMKRRFELVSAELNGMRQAAGTNMSKFADSIAERFDVGEGYNPVRPGGAVTMFMFAFVFGALIPDFGKSSADKPTRGGISSYLPDIRGRLNRPTVPETSDSQTKGNVWGDASRRLRSGSYTTLSNRQLVLTNVQGDLQKLQVEDDVSSLMDDLERFVASMSEKEVHELNQKLEEDRDVTEGAGERLQGLLRYLEKQQGARNEDPLLTSITDTLSNMVIGD